MPCRVKNQHRPRHHTHTVKAANSAKDIFHGFPPIEKPEPVVAEVVAAPVVKAKAVKAEAPAAEEKAPAKPRAPRKKADAPAE